LAGSLALSGQYGRKRDRGRLPGPLLHQHLRLSRRLLRFDEKEFRGFARVEAVTPGDATIPQLVTRSYFDTGRTYECMKGKLLRAVAEREDGAVFSDDTTTWETPPRILRTASTANIRPMPVLLVI